MRIAIALGFLVGSCSQSDVSPTTNDASASVASAPAGAPPAEIARARAVAEQNFREILGTADVRISQADYRPQPNTGLAVLCGTYEQAGVSHRFVFLEDAITYLESQGTPMGMTMDDVIAGYCA